MTETRHKAPPGRTRLVPRRLSTALLLVGVIAAATYLVLSRLQPRPPTETGMSGVTLDPRDPTAHWPKRYRDEPLLMIIEQYVLDTIGELPPQMQQPMSQTVERMFGKKGDWRATVREELGWSPEIDARIRDGWALYQHGAADAGAEVDSLQYAQQFADAVVKLMQDRARDAGR